MFFFNRKTAGEQLSEKVQHFLSHNGFDKNGQLLVVGIPRGGVPVALELARRLHCPLEVIVAKKIPCPDEPEYAIGAVSSDGIVVLNSSIPDAAEWRSYVAKQRDALFDRAKSMEQQFYTLSGCKKKSLENETVIVVDDGIATGMTAMAALRTVKERGARFIILATPVMSANSYYYLRPNCNEIIALSIPKQFNAVGQFYVNFEQTANDEVVAALREATEITAHSDLIQTESKAAI